MHMLRLSDTKTPQKTLKNRLHRIVFEGAVPPLGIDLELGAATQPGFSRSHPGIYALHG